MAEYIGSIFGTGDAVTRENEITADVLAKIRYFIIGYDCVIFKSDGHDFDYILSDNKNSITVSDGSFCAYGYVGSGQQKTFDILPPTVEQYHLIYAELNRSVIPNLCTVKIKNNQSSPYYNTETTFRQDVLSEVKTGIYQLPLWRVKATNKGITEVTDIRPKLLYSNEETRIPQGVMNVYNAVDTHKVAGKLEYGVTCATQAASDNSKKVANTEFVRMAIRAELSK